MIDTLVVILSATLMIIDIVSPPAATVRPTFLYSRICIAIPACQLQNSQLTRLSERGLFRVGLASVSISSSSLLFFSGLEIKMQAPIACKTSPLWYSGNEVGEREGTVVYCVGGGERNMMDTWTLALSLVDRRRGSRGLSGKWNSNPRGARPVHSIITMI